MNTKQASMLRPLPLLAMLLVSMPGLVACSSADTRPEPSGYFATHISEDGAKMFRYTLDSPFDNARGGSPGGPGRPGSHVAGHASGSSSRGVSTGVSVSSASRPKQGGQNQGRNLLDQVNNDLDSQLEQALRESQFCREGYRETERVIELQTIFVAGECKERATAADRAEFEGG